MKGKRLDRNGVLRSVRFIDLTGQRSGRLVAKSPNDERNAKRGIYWNCDCDCGNTAIVLASRFLCGKTKSCGCLREDTRAMLSSTHGCSQSYPEYKTWLSMRRRVLDPNNYGYKNYGGRGIKLCERWINSFENFLTDMGRKPSPKHSLDRINVDGNYEPSNCRWATWHEQFRNMRKNTFLIAFGAKKLILDWARELGVAPQTISGRLYRGWTPEDAVSTPPKTGPRKKLFDNQPLTV